MSDLITVEINCPDRATAERIAEAVITRRLAAAANIHAPIASLYHWQGEVRSAEEVPLVLKTEGRLFDALVAAVLPLHPYETPAILARPIAATTEAYRSWLRAELKE